MIEYPVSRHTAVTVAMRPRESRTGRGERFEAQALQDQGAADVPWIGDGETSCLMQFVKYTALVGNTGTGVGHAKYSLGTRFNPHCARDGELAHVGPSLYLKGMRKSTRTCPLYLLQK